MDLSDLMACTGSCPILFITMKDNIRRNLSSCVENPYTKSTFELREVEKLKDHSDRVH